jgi:hypothetical protein
MCDSPELQSILNRKMSRTSVLRRKSIPFRFLSVKLTKPPFLVKTHFFLDLTRLNFNCCTSVTHFVISLCIRVLVANKKHEIEPLKHEGTKTHEENIEFRIILNIPFFPYFPYFPCFHCIRKLFRYSLAYIL